MFKKSPINTKERKRFRRKKIKKIGILVGFETKLKKKIRKLLRNIIEIWKKSLRRSLEKEIYKIK